MEIQKKIRVGVSGHDLKFWLPLQHALEATGRYEFRHDLWRGHDDHDPAQSDALIAWADVLIAEWALGNAVYYSRHKRSGQRLYVRFHAQELRTEYPMRLDYEGVDSLIFVGAHVFDEACRKFGIQREKCRVIGNYVDCKKFDLQKYGDSEFVLGMIGISPRTKRVDLALDTLEELLRRDERYCLRIKGASPVDIPWLWARTSERTYYKDVFFRINSGPLKHKVIFDPPGNDVRHWLQMVGFILSPSERESFHMAVAEGAASGAIPVLWKWSGSDNVYPEFLRVDDAKSAADFIEHHVRSEAGRRYREHAKIIVRSRYDGPLVAGQWHDILGNLAGKTIFDSRPGREYRKNLLIVWAIDNWPNFHRREMLTALASHLEESHDILVIEPGTHMETIQKLGWEKHDDLSMVAGGKVIRECRNIYRTRLLTGGIPCGVDKAPYVGKEDMMLVLDGFIEANFPYAKNVLHWVYKPDQAERLGSCRKFVYEVYDEYTMNFASGAVYEDVARMEPLALQRAAHVFFTSQPLMERKSAMAQSFSLIGNGVATEIFARHRLARSERRRRPVVGYLGNLAGFFDWGLMEEVCRQLPDVDFVFHGRVELDGSDPRWGAYERMKSFPNVLFTGWVGRDAGAAAVNRYDVLIIPFVVNDAIHAVNPLKLWEYFATGLPVVSSPMDAIKDVARLVRMVRTPREWVEAISTALDEADEGAESRIRYAEQNDWNTLTSLHADVVRTLSR